jgi:outer membrane protein OmpA-like peptidoglycan-associated protein
MRTATALGPQNQGRLHRSVRTSAARREHPTAHLQRSIGNRALQRVCESCRQEDERQLQPKSEAGELGGFEAPPIVDEVLRSPGQPLDAAAEPLAARLGVDARNVSVHVDSEAARSAKAVQALAYTVGSSIVFGAGQYRPHAADGQRLIAHELAHVAQQAGGAARAQRATAGPLEVSRPDDPAEREADVAADEAVRGTEVELERSTAPAIQRTCWPHLGTASPTCAPATFSPMGERFLFEVNCDDLRPGESSHLAAFASGLRKGITVTLHGFASEEGPADFNTELSCNRANKIARLLAAARPDVNISSPNVMHGATLGPHPENRCVIVQTPPRPTCGPDATDWFVKQVAAAKADPAVLGIQALLRSAHVHAAAAGLTSERILEGAVLEKVLDEERRRGKPTRTGASTAQIAAGAAGASELGSAERTAAAEVLGSAVSPFTPLDATTALLQLRDAALRWKALVATRARYDFKNDTRTMKNPGSNGCPVDCRGTISFCAMSSMDCYQTDVPGNLFYAHIGGWVGFSELALQLGSQFAQLDSTATWDPPEDTAMIALGFRLPDPLTRAALCGAVTSSRSIFVARPCDTCSEPTTAVIV